MRASLAAIAAMLALVASCGGARAKVDPKPASARTWEYALSVGAEGAALTLEARFDSGSGPLACDEDTIPYVRDVEIAMGASSATCTTLAPPWNVACAAGCRVRYRFALRDAALALHDPEEAAGAGSAFAATTTAWLLHPEITDGEVGRIRIHVIDGASRFATAMRSTEKDVYEIAFSDMQVGTLAAFGDVHVQTTPIGGAKIELAVVPQSLTLDEGTIAKWIDADASAIAKDLGRFPVERMLVVAMENDLAGPSRGVTLGGGGASLFVRVSKDAKPSTVIADDWVATHEMLHVSMPMLPREQVWLSEGLASYLEPFIRARVGMISPEKVWRDLVEGLPQGMPEPYDQGLDVTHTWGRTYWGGTLFCLLADLEIRERTHGEKSLDDVFRGANAVGGNVLQFWPVARFLDVGDKATNTTVLRELYDKMAHAPYAVDLPALWKKLGVEVTSDAVRFDDDAPLGKLRRAMTDPIR